MPFIGPSMTHGSPRRYATLNNLDHSNSQIVRISHCQPPQSEKTTESYSRPNGKLLDSQKMENALGDIAAALQDADIVFGDLHVVTDHRTKRVVRSWRGGTFNRLSFQLGWVPPHPTFYMRREVAQKRSATTI